MIHPDTALKFVNPQIGHGVFATAFIPLGTIVYVADALEIKIEADHPLRQDPLYKNIIDRYTFIEPDGCAILSWDIAKHVNHCCHYNILSTGYGFEIAVRDITAGEEITDDYGIFNLENALDLVCQQPACRQKVTSTDFEHCTVQWDSDIKRALSRFQHVPQPLLPYVDPDTYRELMLYLETGIQYKSIIALKLR
jgi:hypothetical protein